MLNSIVFPNANPATPVCNHIRRVIGLTGGFSRSDSFSSGGYPSESSSAATSESRTVFGSKVITACLRGK